MRKFTFSFLCFILIGNGLLFAQNCRIYSGYSVGSVFKTVRYDDRDRIVGTTKSLIVQYVPVQDGRVVTLNATYRNEKDFDFEIDIDINCHDGDVSIGMEYLIDPESLAEHTGVNMEMIGDDLLFPAEAKAGDRLNNGSLTLAIGTGSPLMLNLSTLVTNRTLVSFESIEVPAGSFECTLIKYSLLLQEGVIQKEFEILEYYNENLGIIRSEKYNKKGKLISYSQLEEIKG